MDIYRDYGSVGNNVFPPNHFNITKRGQVWQTTHDGAGNSLPYRYRSFISFSFGDKWIEEFDLIAYCKGDTMTRSGSAAFEDLTTSYDIMDGQYYHGTHYKPNTLSLDLVSDGIDQQKLEDFLHWFSGGKTRELVLAEHPNRAIMARVAEAPQIDMTPFEQPITINIGGIEYTTSTTVYRGTISLSLVSDTPFWYARQNFLIYNVTSNKGIFQGIYLKDDSGTSAEAKLRRDRFKEAIKVMYEDNVPLDSMIQSTMHFGENQYAVVDNDLKYSLIAGYIISGGGQPDNWAELSSQPGYFIYNNKYYVGAAIDGTVSGTDYLGRIAGAMVANESTELSGPIPPGGSIQLFYGGTAPSPTTLSFTINLAPSVNGGYIDCIANQYAPGPDGKEYSRITVTSIHEKYFDFSTPNVITSWNKAYKMFNDIDISSTGTNWKDFADDLRDQIRHPAVRTFAVNLVNYIQDTNSGQSNLTNQGIFTNTGKTACINIMKRFFQSHNTTNNTWSDTTASFTFDAATGQAIGNFYYWQDASSDRNIVADMLSNIAATRANAQFTLHTEDVGDMLRSNWLFLEDRNRLVNNQYVSAWTLASPQNAHKVTHNARGSLIDLKIQYKNMYL